MAIDLQSELTECRRAILSMGAAVEQRVNHVIDAMLQNDFDVARGVRRGDAEIDAMDLDIEAECLRILALSQPVAGDLRFVLAVMRINGDLERIGDCAKSIGKRVMALTKGQPIAVPPSLVDMASATREMLSNALEAFADEDVPLSRQVRRDDQRVDDLQKEIFAWVQEQIPRDVDSTKAAIDILSIARKLERISDLCTNIAEDVIFFVEGSVVRHRRGPEEKT